MKWFLFLALLLLPTAFAAGQIPDDFPFDSLYVYVEGDTVHLINYTNTYCSFDPRIEVSVSNDTVTVREIDQSPGITTCTCVFSIQAKITNLIPGTYVLVLLRTIPTIQDTDRFVGSLTFTVTSPPSGIVAVSNYRTQCGQVIQSVRSDDAVLPSPFLVDVFPNPFNSTTVVTLTVKRRDKIRLSVTDAAGRIVARLGENSYAEGMHRIPWTAERESSGTYFIVVEGGSHSAVRKIVLLK